MILPAPTRKERRRLAALRRADRRADAVLYGRSARLTPHPAWGFAIAAAVIAALLTAPTAAAIAVALSGLGAIVTAPDPMPRHDGKGGTDHA